MVVLARHITSRPRPGGDARGNAASRRRRKERLLADFGNGTTCPCAHCGTRLMHAALEADRIVPDLGYVYANVIPSCRTCNSSRSNNAAWHPTS